MKCTIRRSDILVILGLSFLGGLFSVAVDFDHIWVWVLHVSPPIIFSGPVTSAGRPFHTWYIFLLYSMVVSAWLTAFMVRHIQPRVIDWRLTE